MFLFILTVGSKDIVASESMLEAGFCLTSFVLTVVGLLGLNLRAWVVAILVVSTSSVLVVSSLFPV